MTSFSRSGSGAATASFAPAVSASSLPPSAAGQTSAHEVRQVIEALVAEDTRDSDAIASFFAAAPRDDSSLHQPDEHGHDDDPHMSRGSKLAMFASVAMVVAGSLAWGGFEAYTRFVMPLPEAPLSDSERESSMSAAHASDAAPPAAQPAPSLPAADPQPGEPQLRFDDLLAVGQAYTRVGQNERAVDVYDRALTLAPNAAPALAGKALALLGANDPDTAKRLATQAATSDPSNALAWLTLGSVEDQLGAGQAAQAAYRHCTETGLGDYVQECRKLLR